MKPDQAKIAGSMLLVLGLGFFTLVSYEIIDKKQEVTHPFAVVAAMALSSFHILAGLAYLMPRLVTSLTERLKRIPSSLIAICVCFGLGLGFFTLSMYLVVDLRMEALHSMWVFLGLGVAGVFFLFGLSFFYRSLVTEIVVVLFNTTMIVTPIAGKIFNAPDELALRKRLLGLLPTNSEFDAEARRHSDVPGMLAPPPLPDEWNYLVRPYLHQASQYMAPTYYLNGHLQVIDWNLGFDLIFEEIIGELRGRHVNWFIARLKNSVAVFGHARGFPDKVERQPQVDTEPLVYASKRFGLIEFEKIATKLHDSVGQQKGWTVTLMVRKINSWETLVSQLADKIEDDKFWSIYSVSYDRVLLHYSGYDQLVRNVVRCLPDSARHVVDLGTGTGNVSRVLLEGDRTVWAIEKNMSMLDMFLTKDFVAAAGDRLKIVKSSAEHLEMLAAEDLFDAAVAVNALYAVDDVPSCLASLNRVLRIGATFALSTTYEATDLIPLLADIQSELSCTTDWKELAPHYARVHSLNMNLQKKGLTTRYTREQYSQWLKEAGFQVDRCETGHYVNAVIVIRATKVSEVAAPSTASGPDSVVTETRIEAMASTAS